MNGEAMNSVLICAATFLTVAVAAAQAAPSKADYGDARKQYNEMGYTMSRSMLWGKKTQTERAAAVQSATALRNRAVKLWGEPSQCAAAAAAHLDLVVAMNQAVGLGGLETQSALNAMITAERLGSHRAACYDAVEELDTPAKK